jgi:hypothetical protein
MGTVTGGKIDVISHIMCLAAVLPSGRETT